MTDTTESQAADQSRRSIDREAQKPSHAEVRALLDELIEAFPACFKPHGAKDQPPLAIGVEADILLHRPHIDPDRLGRALQVYTAGPEYYRSVIAGSPRVDLDGVVRAAITSEEIGQAERLLLEFESRARSRKIPASEGHAVLAELVMSFPACFKPRDVRGRPAVAIGIHSDILERRPDLDLPKVRKALWVYVTGLDYFARDDSWSSVHRSRRRGDAIRYRAGGDQRETPPRLSSRQDQGRASGGGRKDAARECQFALPDVCEAGTGRRRPCG